MAFKLKAGNTGNPMHKNYASSFPKKTKTLGTRKDYTQVEDRDVNTLTKTSERTGKSKTRDISQKRADRIEKRQARKKMAPDAREDVRNSGKNETEEQMQNRVEGDFPPGYGTKGYDGPTSAELEARWKITDKAKNSDGTREDSKKDQPTSAEVAKLKKEIEMETLGKTL